MGCHNSLVSIPVLSFQSANTSYRPFDGFGVLTSGFLLPFLGKMGKTVWDTQGKRRRFSSGWTQGNRANPGDTRIPRSTGEQSFFLGGFPRDYFLIPGDFNFIPGDIPGEFSIPGDFVAAP